MSESTPDEPEDDSSDKDRLDRFIGKPNEVTIVRAKDQQ